jgi:phage shock protein A
MASGAIDDMVSGPRDDIQLELDRMGASHDVDAELARLKGELGQGSAPRQIEASAASADGAAPGNTVAREGRAGEDGQAAPTAPPAQPQAGDGT